ncbi:transposase [Deltaproteobacteria bacterium TL4]
MQVLKAFRFRLEPHSSQLKKLAQFAGCSRFVWNKALALQKGRLEQHESVLTYTQLASLLVEWKKEEETSFLKDTHSQTLQQTLKALDRALWDGLKQEKGLPRFKKKGIHDSFSYPQGFKFNGETVFLPKLGWVPFRQSREIEGIPKNVTVSRQGKHWFVSIQVALEIAEPQHPATAAIGVDMGIARFATFSDGESLKPLNSFKKLENKLAKEQKNLSRKVKFSNNWKKQKYKVTDIHIKIANTRKDFLHKASNDLSKNHAVIVLEDLKVSNMSASAKGTVENPGKNVKAKSGLNKSILDQGWYEFRRQLIYKQQWRGGKVILVPPKNTSRRCSVCGHTEEGNRPSQALFLCLKCGHSENADVNAAKNILVVGQAMSACEDIRPLAV